MYSTQGIEKIGSTSRRFVERETKTYLIMSDILAQPLPQLANSGETSSDKIC